MTRQCNAGWIQATSSTTTFQNVGSEPAALLTPLMGKVLLAWIPE
jgi:hypothetical protein